MLHLTNEDGRCPAYAKILRTIDVGTDFGRKLTVETMLKGESIERQTVGKTQLASAIEASE